MTNDDIIIDRSRSVPLFSPVCCMCKHWDKTSFEREAMQCTAFPNGIPTEIWLGENNHTSPYKGDNGIQFEAIGNSKKS